MLVWVVYPVLVAAGALVVTIVVVRVVAAVVPLYWVSDPEQVRRWARALPVVEATAVLPPQRRELGQ